MILAIVRSGPNDHVVQVVCSAIIMAIALVFFVTIAIRLRRHARRVRAMKNCEEWTQQSVTLSKSLQYVIEQQGIDGELKQSHCQLTEALSLLVLDNMRMGWRQVRLAEWIAMEAKCKATLKQWKDLALQLRDAVGSVS